MTEPDLSTLSPERQAAYWRDRAAAFDRLAELDLVANLHPAPAPGPASPAVQPASTPAAPGSTPSAQPAGSRQRRGNPGAVRAARQAYVQAREKKH